MTKNFKVRLCVSLALLAIAAVCLFIADSIPFKIFFGVFAVVALIELMSFLKRKVSSIGIILGILEIIFLVCSVIFVAKANVAGIILLIIGVCGYDVFAYLFGKAFGSKIFKKSRPFPHISKNKTWEGTVCGLLSSELLIFVAIMIITSNHLCGSNSLCEMLNVFYWCGPLALVGDLFESFLKRQFNVKDSNEIVIKNKFFAKLELLVGGSEGHGGYLDRIDSMAFTATILLIICAIL